ncbi:endonuclease V [Haloarculaceae archaeon H-GB2-1]|nr:endonuclease V [Haloarculaceae archaeon H-GB1-1]MEA5386257.1 endonuclease V [Haloarculaceae archaeon H-GB11]MEA5407760.1 endonuclease V [Haloarculaceae archaeon H-GB2-1]
MEVVHPEFVPDPTLSRAEMETLQTDIAAAAVFEDDLPCDPAQVCVDADGDEAQTRLGDAEPPTIAGVDQAFLDDDRAVSAVVVFRDGEIIERVHAVVETEIPYIPGLLSFREGGAILAAFELLDSTPDLAFVDGSGRIHFREAGLATHIGVTLDLPTIGVAKRLLCGTPRTPIPEDGLPEGDRIAIESDDDVTAPDGTVIGYAVQTRQYDSGARHVNPLYVSPGHRVSAETAADLVAQCAAGYKLPEPTRVADAYADEAKGRVN